MAKTRRTVVVRALTLGVCVAASLLITRPAAIAASQDPGGKSLYDQIKSFQFGVLNFAKNGFLPFFPIFNFPKQ